MRLAAIEHGEAIAGQPSLVIAHGVFGSARNWGTIARRLGQSRHVVAVDMRNHGDSGWDEDHSYAALARDLEETVGALGSGAADVLGHSMGGKAAMMLALTRPAMVARLIVVDIAPVGYDHSLQEYVDAMRAIDLSAVDSRRDADRQLAEAVPEAGIRAFLLQSLDTAEGQWKLNLEVLDTQMTTLTAFPEVEGRFDGPALFLNGGTSNYLTEEVRPEVTALFPQARFVTVDDAGHWVHAERPDEVVASIEEFLAET